MFVFTDDLRHAFHTPRSRSTFFHRVESLFLIILSTFLFCFFGDVVVSTQASAAGSLTVEMNTRLSKSSSVNLSSEGSLDWAQWGYSSAGSFNHKGGVISQISNITPTGSMSPKRWDGLSVSYSWTGGTPTASVTNTQTKVYVEGLNNGFEFTVPAASTIKILSVYLTTYRAKGRFEATLSDNSAPAYVGTVENDLGGDTRVVRVSFAAASNGAILKVRYTLIADYSSDVYTGNVTLQAATLKAVSQVSAAGSLTGEINTTLSSVNLSTEGSLDWAQWGYSSATSFDHKGGVTSQISNITRIGSVTPQRWVGLPVSYSWTGGTPTANVTNTQTEVYVTGLNNGFEFTVPAASTVKTLSVYLTSDQAKGRVEATLSDNSAPAYVGYLDNTQGTTRIVRLSFAAASNSATLKVRYTLTADYGSGNVTLQAATLITGIPSAVATAVNTPTSVNLALNGGSVAVTSSPSHGTVSVNGGLLVYTPASGYVGQDTLTYKVTANNGAVTVGTLSINVGCLDCVANVNLTVAWGAASQSARGYLVYYGSSSTTATKQLSDLDINQREVDPQSPSITYNAKTDLGLDGTGPVCFRVKAYNSVGESDFSQAACVNI